MNDAETVAAYEAIIRHKLGLRPGADALAALEARLSPDDSASRPPQRAPGILRLKKALRALRRGKAPDVTFETLTEDLRFLRLFDDGGRALSRDAMQRLLDDVLAEPPPRVRKAAPARIVPLRRRKERP